ncbi:MAG: DNA replication/repair protein RecF [Pseudomonadota bacterium]
MRRIRRVTLRNVRSYEALDLPLDGRSVALTGPNGAGKTNLLEALSLLGPGRGLRRTKMADIARQAGPGGWGIGLALEGVDDDEPVHLSAQAPPPPAPLKRNIRIDGTAVTSATACLDYIRFSWLTPAQDRLFVDGASERRRFLDRMTMAQDKVHALTSSSYEKAMRQRQASLSTGRSDPRLLSVLERQMAESGVAVAAARRETVASLALGYAGLRTGPFPSAVLALEGQLEKALEHEPAAAVEDAFAEALARGRHRDREVGRTLEGPHRSDLLVTHGEKEQPAHLCSTGEQKALLIGLVLAHATSLQSVEEAPLVLLLDEVAAHLDPDRRSALADILSALGCQSFMTGTDSLLFAPWAERAAHFHVVDGKVEVGPT